MTHDPSLASCADVELLPRIAAGDAGAFGELFRRRRGDVFRFALHMTGARAVAEDVAQDVFLVVMREAARYESGRAGVGSWLCGIARNCARQRLEKDGPLAEADRTAHEPAILSDPVEDLTQADGIERLRRAILTLPITYREAVVLCDLQELSYAEAAEAIGCAVGTVRSRLHRGRALLAAKVLAASERRAPVKVPSGRCFA
jgi:RNA polymerase sigma-70 factor (ECF subfamily)